MGLVQWERGKTYFKGDVVTPAKVEKAKRTSKRLASDEEETAKVHERSKGQCEVTWFGKKAKKITRCQRPRMLGVHHMISGWGKRARGLSLLAAHKQDVCAECHDLITGKVLKRVGGEVPMWTDEYERVDR